MAKISKAELIRLQKKLKTDARIGEEFGITRQAIHQLRKKYGIKSRIAGNKERKTVSWLNCVKPGRALNHSLRSTIFQFLKHIELLKRPHQVQQKQQKKRLLKKFLQGVKKLPRKDL